MALELQKPDAQGLRLLLNEALDGWDLAASPLRAFAHRWASSGREVTLVLSSADIARLSEDIRRDRDGLAAAPNVIVASRSTDAAASASTLLAEVWGSGRATAWASASPAQAIPGPD